MRLLTLWGLLSLLLCVPIQTLASVLAIDYGSDFIKASLMKPGVPFDVLLNKDSKRKICSVVSWKKGDRMFGQDAFNIVCLYKQLKVYDVKNNISRLPDFLPTPSLLSKFSKRPLSTLRSYHTTPKSQPPISWKPHGIPSVSVRATERNGQPKN